MLNPSYVLVTLFLLTLPTVTSADSFADKFAPGTPYYFNDFNPEQQPWEPGQHLNIEEVFKNYQYYKIVFDQDGMGITVNQYIRGSKNESIKYLVLPDNSLQKR